MTIRRRTASLFVHSAIDDKPMSSKAFRVYSHLCRRADSDNVAFPSVQSIGDHCFGVDSDSPTTRRKWAVLALKELIDIGMITRQARQRKDGGSTSSLYFIEDIDTPVVPTSTGGGTGGTQGGGTDGYQEGTPGSKGNPPKGESDEDFALATILNSYTAPPKFMGRDSHMKYEMWLDDHVELVKKYGRDVYAKAVSMCKETGMLDGRNSEHVERKCGIKDNPANVPVQEQIVEVWEWT